MRYAVALTLTKHEPGSVNMQTRLSFHHQCDSREQALGEAFIEACKALPDYSVAIHLVEKIGPDEPVLQPVPKVLSLNELINIFIDASKKEWRRYVDPDKARLSGIEAIHKSIYGGEE